MIGTVSPNRELQLEDLLFCEDDESDDEVVFCPGAQPTEFPQEILQNFKDGLVYDQGAKRVAEEAKKYHRSESNSAVKVRMRRKRKSLPIQFKDIASLKNMLTGLPNEHCLTIFLNRQKKNEQKTKIGTLHKEKGGSISLKSLGRSTNVDTLFTKIAEEVTVDIVDLTEQPPNDPNHLFNDSSSIKITPVNEPSTKIAAHPASRSCISAIVARISALAKRIFQSIFSFFGYIKAKFSRSNSDSGVEKKSIENPAVSPPR